MNRRRDGAVEVDPDVPLGKALGCSATDSYQQTMATLVTSASIVKGVLSHPAHTSNPSVVTPAVHFLWHVTLWEGAVEKLAAFIEPVVAAAQACDWDGRVAEGCFSFLCNMFCAPSLRGALYDHVGSYRACVRAWVLLAPSTTRSESPQTLREAFDRLCQLLCNLCHFANDLAKPSLGDVVVEATNALKHIPASAMMLEMLTRSLLHLSPATTPWPSLAELDIAALMRSLGSDRISTGTAGMYAIRLVDALWRWYVGFSTAAMPVPVCGTSTTSAGTSTADCAAASGDVDDMCEWLGIAVDTIFTTMWRFRDDKPVDVVLEGLQTLTAVWGTDRGRTGLASRQTAIVDAVDALLARLDADRPKRSTLEALASRLRT